MTEGGHQLLKPLVKYAERPQMLSRADHVINIRTRGAHAAPDKIGLALKREIAGILRMPSIHKKAERRHGAVADIHKLHRLHRGAISVGYVLTPVQIGPRIRNEAGRNPEGHAFALAAFIEPQHKPRRGINAAMDHGIDAKR